MTVSLVPDQNGIAIVNKGVRITVIVLSLVAVGIYFGFMFLMGNAVS